jgi:ATP-dependent RNA helicase DeaD
MYEPPEDHEVYIHRAGRTGRAGAGGEVITLVDVMQELELKRIAQQYGIDLEKRDMPTDEDVQQVVSARARAMLENRLRGADSLTRERMQRFVPLIKELAQDGQDVLLAAQILDDYYQKKMHTPDVPKAEPPKEQQAKPDSGKRRRKRRPRKRKKSQEDNG